MRSSTPYNSAFLRAHAIFTGSMSIAITAQWRKDKFFFSEICIKNVVVVCRCQANPVSGMFPTSGYNSGLVPK